MPKGNIRVERIQNLLKERGFSFRGQADRVTFWRCSGLTVHVPRTAWTKEERARAVLRQAGLEREEIERFIVQYRDPACGGS